MFSDDSKKSYKPSDPKLFMTKVSCFLQPVKASGNIYYYSHYFFKDALSIITIKLDAPLN